MNDIMVITANRGPSKYRHAVNGRPAALRIMAGLRSGGWQNIKATPQREVEAHTACMTAVICGIALVIAVVVYGIYVNVEKRAMWAATCEEVAK